MFKVMVFLAVVTAVVLAVLLVVQVPRCCRSRRIATAEKRAVWQPYRRINEQGEWEIGCERRWKKTVVRALPYSSTLPLATDSEELLRLEGQAIADAGLLNRETL